MKNKYLLFVLFALTFELLSACPVCDKQQPKITQGFTHGAGPQSNWDWVIITITTVITMLTLAYSIKYLVRPGEKNRDHIKRSVLNN